jgi:NAD(P)-dependent dehydrogenase (short-subunit alcohol dehydrogenase family)
MYFDESSSSFSLKTGPGQGSLTPCLPGAADVIGELADSLGGIDVLVNNAGTGDPTGEFLMVSYEACLFRLRFLTGPATAANQRFAPSQSSLFGVTRAL